MTDFETLETFRPTAFDLPLRCTPDEDSESAEWFVFPYSQNRDSQPIDESNFAAIQAAFEAADPDGEHHEIQRYGHWGPGWFEILVFRAPLLDVARDLVARLESYPVLDEWDLSDRECEATGESWDCWGRDGFARAACKAYPTLAWALTWLATEGQDPEEWYGSVPHETWDEAWGASGGRDRTEFGGDGPHFPIDSAVRDLRPWVDAIMARATEAGAFVEQGED